MLILAAVIALLSILVYCARPLIFYPEREEVVMSRLGKTGKAGCGGISLMGAYRE